ncbi:serine hydrolase domain-containing protein [Hoyosella altamirensis]|uniref:Beta-lactamase n=1 Tax=Hoyosella altamirensis TaxID=616997 RepID=A0A839RN52_9ACTN|nr:serine hydrolase domain-containing protein [Hoyosella altamirensis]MBB3038175.1 CubicO group peptidase (beta-lactamase class C family) [Hoyosella altamirensis]
MSIIRARWSAAALVVTITAAALMLGVYVRPAPSTLPDEPHGDRELASLVREIAGSGHRALAAAVVTPSGQRVTSVGAELDDRFEVGSISKGITGLLLADAISRGDVTPGTTAGSVLPELVGTPAASITLAELATHRSGLPVQVPGFGQYLRNSWATWTGAFPYSASVGGRLEQVRTIDPDMPPETYSNLGFEVLGAALAAAAGQDYPDLVTERILTPAGMTRATVPTSMDDLDRKDLPGEDQAGRMVTPWAGEALAPAGGLRAGIGDMAGLLTALLEGTTPGLDALEPREQLGEDEIGWGWITTTTDAGDTVVWHNGATSGFSAFIAVDRENNVGVALLSATGGFVDDAGWELLDEARMVVRAER